MTVMIFAVFVQLLLDDLVVGVQRNGVGGIYVETDKTQSPRIHVNRKSDATLTEGRRTTDEDGNL